MRFITKFGQSQSNFYEEITRQMVVGRLFSRMKIPKKTSSSAFYVYESAPKREHSDPSSSGRTVRRVDAALFASFTCMEQPYQFMEEIFRSSSIRCVVALMDDCVRVNEVCR